MKITSYLLFVLLLVFVGCDSDNEAENTPAVPMCYISPGEANLPLGEQTEFEIVLQDIPDSLFALSCRLIYDPAMLEFIEYAAPATERFFGDEVVEFTAAEDSVIHIAISRTQGQPMVAGSGVVCRLRFAAEHAGASSLSLPSNHLIFYDIAGQEVMIPNLEISGATIAIP